jgi:thiamine-phosphate pyrophosphorylase
MSYQTSPGVDRAIAAAKDWAKKLSAPNVRLVHYLLALVGEEDGKSVALLKRLGHDPQDVLARLVEAGRGLLDTVSPSALLDSAREWSIARRADPTLMTDALLIAVLRVQPEVWKSFAPFDTLADRVESLLGLEPSPMAGPDEPPVSFDLPDEVDLGAARVLDANFNRSREALRVLEDYARFVLNDAFLTKEIKAARHDLVEAVKRLPARLLIASRDTLGDVGTSATAAGEYQRTTPSDVAQVNIKRLQESLRSLEEFGKVYGAELGRLLESIRYRTYTIERALTANSDARDRLRDARLYVLLTGAQCVASLDWTIAQAAAGGADVFQLREKNLPDRELLERARNVRRWTRAAHVLFIMNDRPDIAKLAEADGVHLGQDDLSVRDARRILGPEPLIGVSTHSLNQVRQAVRDGADYLGIGPTFPSRTKNFEAFPGLDFVRETVAETSLPAFALGGIEPGNIREVIAAGAQRIAVSSCIACADDPEPVARVLRTALRG